MNPGDELAHRIKLYVASQVPPDQVDVVTRAVCMTVATLMRDPSFTNELQVIRDLRQENAWLRNQCMILQETLVRYKPVRKTPAKKSPAAKKVSKANKRSFQQGVRDVRGSR